MCVYGCTLVLSLILESITVTGEGVSWLPLSAFPFLLVSIERAVVAFSPYSLSRAARKPEPWRPSRRAQQSSSVITDVVAELSIFPTWCNVRQGSWTGSTLLCLRPTTLVSSGYNLSNMALLWAVTKPHGWVSHDTTWTLLLDFTFHILAHQEGQRPKLLLRRLSRFRSNYHLWRPAVSGESDLVEVFAVTEPPWAWQNRDWRIRV